MDSLFLGVYWKERYEHRAACASRICEFLQGASVLHNLLAGWFLPMGRGHDVLKPVDTDRAVIEGLLQSNNRDATGEPIAQLGYAIYLWNGKNVSFSANLGSFSAYVGNAVVVSFREEVLVNEDLLRRLMELAIDAFDPDSCVVTSHQYIDSHGGGRPVEAGGWFTYQRGGRIERHPSEEK